MCALLEGAGHRLLGEHVLAGLEAIENRRRRVRARRHDDDGFHLGIGEQFGMRRIGARNVVTFRHLAPQLRSKFRERRNATILRLHQVHEVRKLADESGTDHADV